MNNVVEKNFVQTMRAVEHSLGIPDSLPGQSSVLNLGNVLNATQAFATTATLSTILSSEVCKVLQEAIPIILQIALELNIDLAFGQDGLGPSSCTRRSLVSRCGLNPEFVSACRVDHAYLTASWISTGNSITLLTLLLQPWDHKDTTIIYITRKFQLSFLPFLVMNLIFPRFGVCFSLISTRPI
jgi:hypothetical protein